MPDTTILKFTAPTLTCLTAATAQTESRLPDHRSCRGDHLSAVNQTTGHPYIMVFGNDKGTFKDASKGVFNDLY